ncbi:MAG: GAF domain-containing protein [Candidatus Omnitrophica bacterium]|nr:GAF domain-containing protein [Candidatus Omnitrophota bacterium]
MNLFALAGLSVTVVCFLLAFFIFINVKRHVHRLWALFNISVGIFGFGTFLVGISQTYDQAFLSWKITIFGVSLIAMFFYHVIYEFCQLNDQKMLRFVYCHGILFAFLGVATNTTFHSMRYAFNQFYYYKAGVGFNILFPIWLFIVFTSFGNLFVYFNRIGGIKQIQGKYLFWGMLLGFLGGSTTSFPSWGIDVYPAWHFFICVYIAISTYAIFKYQLMDIRVAITRLGVFVIVYSLVLGIPFGLAFWGQEWLKNNYADNWWIVPLVFSTVLATIGPFIFIFIQKKAEDRLLQEQRQYQATLRQASLGMGQIKDLKRLLNLIVHVVTRAVKIDNCKIFLRHEDSKQFVLKAVKGDKENIDEQSHLGFDSLLVNYFNQVKEPIVYEEIKQKRTDVGGEGLAEIEESLERIEAALVVPSFIEQKLIAIISLGKKRSGKLYTHDDLAVFSILANQSALAIENAQFYEDMQRTHVQLMKAEKMATVGTMADGLSHQINNRLHAMGFIAGDLIDTIRHGKENGHPPKTKELLDEVESGLERIQQNVKHGGEIVGGLLRYTRKGEQGFTSVELPALLKSALEMAQFKIKVHMLGIEYHFDKNIPKIKGNFTQLQEVFFNLIDNAYDAMMQRKDELQENGYKPHLDIYAREINAKIEILIQDNGMGVKETDMHKLFAPFFTTKATSKKGTGLGLYVIRQIIEDNHGGKVNFSSKYRIGSETQIILPIALEKVT